MHGVADDAATEPAGERDCQWSSSNPQSWSSSFPHPSTPRSERWKWKFDRPSGRTGVALHSGNNDPAWFFAGSLFLAGCFATSRPSVPGHARARREKTTLDRYSSGCARIPRAFNPIGGSDAKVETSRTSPLRQIGTDPRSRTAWAAVLRNVLQLLPPLLAGPRG